MLLLLHIASNLYLHIHLPTGMHVHDAILLGYHSRQNDVPHHSQLRPLLRVLDKIERMGQVFDPYSNVPNPYRHVPLHANLLLRYVRTIKQLQQQHLGEQ